MALPDTFRYPAAPWVTLCLPGFRSRCLLVLVLSLPASLGGQDLSAEVITLAHMKQRNAVLLDRVAHYTCLATITRFQRSKSSAPDTRLDTLHLEVAQISHREVYSWPGASAFSERSLGELVQFGTVGGGAFASHARNLFVNDLGTESFVGKQRLAGRDVLQWRFRISPLVSNWDVAFRGTTQRVGAEGFFWADAGSLDLLRLETRAADLLPGFPVFAVVTTTEFAPVHIGSDAALLPQRSELVVTATDGSETRSVTDFSSCREYVGSSSISFGGPTFDAAAATPPSTNAHLVELPAGIEMKIKLTGPLDLTLAAVGDPIEGSLVDGVRAGGEYLPKGSVIAGRLRQASKDSEDPVHYTVGIEFDEIRFNGKAAKFYASLQGIDPPVPGLSTGLTHATVEERRMPGKGGKAYITRGEKRQVTEIPGVGMIFVTSETKNILPRGITMIWTTVNL